MKTTTASYQLTNKQWSESSAVRATRAGAPNLGCSCLSEGVQLGWAIEGKNIFIYYLFPNIDTYITVYDREYYFQK